MRAGTRIVWALVVSVLTLALLPARFAMELRAVAAWDAFAITALLSTWFTILTLEPAQIHASARREDPSRVASMVLVLMGASTTALAENGPLAFPGAEGVPDSLDFAYVAFVVGMTAQTLGVAIRGRWGQCRSLRARAMSSERCAADVELPSECTSALDAVRS